MKAFAKFYSARPLSWTNKTTGELKTGFLQPYDLDQGIGVRPLQAEIMRNTAGECLPAGDYEVEFFIEKSRNNALAVTFVSSRPVKVDKPVQVNG